MLKYLLPLLILLSPISAHALDAGYGTYFKYGLGLNGGTTDMKTFAFGYQSPLGLVFDYQLEGGMYVDNTEAQGLIGYINADVGLSVISKSGIYAKIFFGPALITQPDDRLSSILEFNHDLEAGFVDKRGVSLGVNYKHMSNAGLFPPNLGRDMLLLKLQIPW